MHSIRTLSRDGGASEQVELLIAGKVVSWLTIVNLRWRIAGREVPFGGIGGVGTDPAFRNRGLSRLCMDRALTRMREKGYPMTALFGIPDYYPKWGYASVIPEYRLKMAARFAAESRPLRGRRVRPFDKARHGGAVLRMSVRQDLRRMGSLVRPPLKSWRAFRMGSWWNVRAENFVIEGAGGRVLGYASHDKKEHELVVVEAGALESSVYGDITAELARRAQEKRLGELEFCLPPDHPYADYLHGWNVEQKIHYFKNSQGMARILDMGALLAILRPALEERSRTLGPKVWSLVLDTDLGAWTLRGKAGRLFLERGKGPGPRVRISQAELSRLILGVRGAEGLGAALEILGTLFPRAFPHVWYQDRY